MASSPTLVAGRYRLADPLGVGGMGRVWRARDETLGRDVAIKEIVPPEGLGASERDEIRRRTVREARAAARLTHPNVVRAYDVFEFAGRPWIVMEYVPSRSLHDVVATDGPLDPVRVAHIGLGVLGALQAAHRAGVMHRDVKPSNVLLADDGRVVLTDFGIATVEGDATVTQTGLVLGSPAYIAPERARDGTTGPESDLWSLGATLYAALEGRSPYERSTAIGTLIALASEEPPPSRNAGPLRPVLNGLLRKDPSARIDAMECERRLRRAVRGEAAGGRRFRWPWTGPPVPQRPTRELPWPVPVPVPVADTTVAGAAPVAGAAASGAAPVADAAASGAAPVVEALPQPSAAPTAPSSAEPTEVVPPEPTEVVAPEPAEVESVVVQPAADQRGPDESVGLAAHSAPLAAELPQEPVPSLPGDAAQPDAARARKRTVVLVAAAIVVVVLLGGIWLVARPSATGERPDVAAPPAPSATASKPQPQNTGLAGSPAPPIRDAVPPRRQRPDLPAGWTLYTDPTGFSLYVPAGWRVSREGTMVYFRGDGRVLGIDQTDQPKLDPVADWQRQRDTRLRRGDFPGYSEVHIKAVPYWQVAADWEFSFNASGGRTHVNNRGVVVSNRRAYGFWWSTPESQWAAANPDLQLVFASFQPAPDAIAP